MTCKQLAMTAVLLLPGGGLRADEPRTVEEIRKKLAEITAPPKKPAAGLAGEREAALRRLNAYRYLAGLDHDVVLDEELTASAQAGANLCEKLGRIDHKPANPGLPEEEYQKGLKGTSTSNLGWGPRAIAPCVDLWMDDSDSGNIDRAGHRRWCLNPAMQKAGFGRAGVFTAMTCFDRSRKKLPDYDIICWPARGLMPVEYFKASQAWTVTLNPKKYQVPGESVKPAVWELDKDGKKVGEPLKLNYTNINKHGFGVPNCIIFRPEKLRLAAGKRYLVEIEGVAPLKGKAAPLRHEVKFVSVK